MNRVSKVSGTVKIMLRKLSPPVRRAFHYVEMEG